MKSTGLVAPAEDMQLARSVPMLHTVTSSPLAMETYQALFVLTDIATVDQLSRAWSDVDRALIH